MKKLVLALILLVGTSAYADTLTFTGSTANGEYGPYSMQLNGGPVTPMICFSDNNWITSHESWSVQAYNISTITSLLNSEFSGNATTYNELGWLADQLFANAGNPVAAEDYQLAIWSVFDPSSPFGTTAGSIQDAKNALDAVLNKNYQTSDVFYIPVGDFSGYQYGVPQPFISQVPEPSSLLLLGVGLLGLVGLSLKKVTV